MINFIYGNKTKWFQISSIFKKIKIKKYNKIPDEEGNVPFVSSSSENDGIVGFVKCKSSFNKPCLTVSTNGDNFDTFYHDYPIAVSSDVEILFNDTLSENQYLFIATILKLEKSKWSYGRKAKNDAVYRTLIKLPVNDDDSINWTLIESYIKTLRERERERIVNLLKV